MAVVVAMMVVVGMFVMKRMIKMMKMVVVVVVVMIMALMIALPKEQLQTKWTLQVQGTIVLPTHCPTLVGKPELLRSHSTASISH